MSVRRNTPWTVRVEDGHSGQSVEVWLSDRWFADAEDLDDAEDILIGQRASSYVLDENGYTSERTL